MLSAGGRGGGFGGRGGGRGDGGGRGRGGGFGGESSPLPFFLFLRAIRLRATDAGILCIGFAHQAVVVAGVAPAAGVAGAAGAEEAVVAPREAPRRAAPCCIRGSRCECFQVLTSGARPQLTGDASRHCQVVVEKHRHEGIFIARGKEDALVTKNMVPGESVYGEKRIASEASSQLGDSRAGLFRGDSWRHTRACIRAARVLGRRPGESRCWSQGACCAAGGRIPLPGGRKFLASCAVCRGIGCVAPRSSGVALLRSLGWPTAFEIGDRPLTRSPGPVSSGG